MKFLVSVVTIGAIIAVHSTGAASETTVTIQQSAPANLQNFLQASAHPILIHFTEQPSEGPAFRDRTQPLPTGAGMAILNREKQCYSVEYAYKEKPSYRPRGTTGYSNMDFDLDDTMTYWRPIHLAAYLTPEGGVRISTNECYRISKEGEAVKQSEYTYRYEIEPNNTDSYLNQLTMAMGLGPFSEADTTIMTTTGTLSHQSLTIPKEANLRSYEHTKGDTFRFLKMDSSPDHLVEFEKTRKMIDSNKQQPTPVE